MELWTLIINPGPSSENWEQQYVASLAMDILKHCALVTGEMDGEDSAGRARVAVMPAAGVAKRACDIAAAVFSEFESRGWVRASAVTEEDLVAHERALTKKRYAD